MVKPKKALVKFLKGERIFGILVLKSYLFFFLGCPMNIENFQEVHP